MRSSNWSGVNFVRWREQQLTLMGGQAQLTNSTGDPNAYAFASRCKKIHGWYSLDSVYHIAYLCERHLYVDTGGTLTDITPADGHGGAGRIDWRLRRRSLYDPPPPDDLYGTERPLVTSVAITRVPDAYSLDNFGSILYAMTSGDGRLLMWDPNVGGPAVVQPEDPGRGPVPNGRCFVVTQERFIQIYGSVNDGTGGGTAGGSARRFAWCDQENPGAWDYPNVTSMAGFLDIEPASPIICADAMRSGVIFWTAKKAYVSQFLGMPYIYNYVELADSCTPWSPQSVVTTSAQIIWMAEQGVFAFDGTSIVPIPCKVRPWIDSNIDNVAVRELSFAAHLSEFNEFWWFFPHSEQRLQHAGCGSELQGGVVDAGAFVAFGRDHSSSIPRTRFSLTTLSPFSMRLAAPTPISTWLVVLPYAETFDLSLTTGSRLTTVKQLIPDVKAIEAVDPNVIANAIGNLRYSLFYRNSRSLGHPRSSRR